MILTGMMEAKIKENIAWSVLNLHYVQRMWQRDGGDGLLNVLSAKHNLFKPRVISSEYLEI